MLRIEEATRLRAGFGEGDVATGTVRLAEGTTAILSELAKTRGQTWPVYSASLLSEHAWGAVNPDLQNNRLITANDRLIQACVWNGIPLDDLSNYAPELTLDVLAQPIETLRVLQGGDYLSEDWPELPDSPPYKLNLLSHISNILTVKAGWILGTHTNPGKEKIVSKGDIYRFWTYIYSRTRGEIPSQFQIIFYYAGGKKNPSKLAVVAQYQPQRAKYVHLAQTLLATFDLETEKGEAGLALAVTKAYARHRLSQYEVTMPTYISLSNGQIHPLQVQQMRKDSVHFSPHNLAEYSELKNNLNRLSMTFPIDRIEAMTAEIAYEF